MPAAVGLLRSGAHAANRTSGVLGPLTPPARVPDHAPILSPTEQRRARRSHGALTTRRAIEQQRNSCAINRRRSPLLSPRSRHVHAVSRRSPCAWPSRVTKSIAIATTRNSQRQGISTSDGSCATYARVIHSPNRVSDLHARAGTARNHRPPSAGYRFGISTGRLGCVPPPGVSIGSPFSRLCG
jgi:hypothetical protein